MLHPETALFLFKLASQEPTLGDRLKTVAKGVGGIALGSLVGAGGAYAADKLHQKLVGKPIPRMYLAAALPALSIGGTLVYNHYKDKERDKLHGLKD